MTAFIERTKNFYGRYERYLSAGALLFGFVIDNLTLKRIDLLFENVVIFSYLLLAGGGITLIQYARSGRLGAQWFQRISPLFLLVQFAFGGLFSAYFVFYSRSGSLTGTLFFLIIILALLVGNEFFRKQYQKLVFQMGILYTSLFSFAIFFIPVLMGTMSAPVFLLSGAVSILLITLFVYLIFLISPARIVEEKNGLLQSIGGIFLFINLLYFANIIPPVPLSLKDIGVYHNIEKNEAGEYLLYKEKSSSKILEFWNTTVHYAPYGRVYVWSSIFAPTNLNTNIFHRWQYFDDTKKGWVTANEISFPIIGGRDEGYRGYSFKESVFPGKWRVDVVTSRGQIVGRISFTIISAEYPPVLFVEKK